MFKKIKSLFIIEDAAQEQKMVKKAEEAHGPAKKVDAVSDVETEFDPSVFDSAENTKEQKDGSKKVDSKFIDILLKAVEKNNLKGFDYLEYKSSLQSLSKMDMDEQTKYQSSMAMASTMGVTPEKLVSSAEHYLKILEKEEGKFGEALKKQKASQITGKENEIKKRKAQVESKRQKIIQLQKEIETEQKALEEVKAGIHKSAAKVQKTSDQFNYAYNIVTGQILDDIEKIKKYLIK